MKRCVGRMHGFIISWGGTHHVMHHPRHGYTKSSMNYQELLARAARAYGIELRYTDTWGRVHETSPEVLRALLASLGFSAGSGEEIARGLAAREAAQWRQPIEPTLVLPEDAHPLPP